MGVNSLSKTVTQQRRGCDLNPGPSAPESSTLRLPSHPVLTHNISQFVYRKEARTHASRSSLFLTFYIVFILQLILFALRVASYALFMFLISVVNPFFALVVSSLFGNVTRAFMVKKVRFQLRVILAIAFKMSVEPVLTDKSEILILFGSVCSRLS